MVLRLRGVKLERTLAETAVELLKGREGKGRERGDGGVAGGGLSVC